MNIQHSTKDNNGTFFIDENGKAIAKMDYKKQGQHTIIIVHTEVEEAFEGKGVGQSLVEEAVDHARKNSIKIKAECSFAKSVLQRSTKYHDVYISS